MIVIRNQRKSWKESHFADEMRKNGIITPKQYQSNGVFAKWYKINAYDVIVTVEQFAENEIKAVDAVIAEKTGKLLANMHRISEKNNLHVQNAVLFNPFAANELFDFKSFHSLESKLGNAERVLFDRIVEKYNAYMKVLAPLKKQPTYAVQGDISNCNLYQTWYPYLYAIIDAFWSSDIKWNEDSLMHAVKNEDRKQTQKWLEIIWQRLITLGM